MNSDPINTDQVEDILGIPGLFTNTNQIIIQELRNIETLKQNIQNCSSQLKSYRDDLEYEQEILSIAKSVQQTKNFIIRLQRWWKKRKIKKKKKHKYK